MIVVPNGRSASLTALVTAAAAPAVPASPAPFAPSSDFQVGETTCPISMSGISPGHRNQIVSHIGVGELTTFVIHAFLEQRGAEALHHATPDLLINQLGVDDGAAILDHPVLQQLHKAGVGIDLQP